MTSRDTPLGRARALCDAARRRAAKAAIRYDLRAEVIAETIAAGLCQATGLPLDMLRAGQRGRTRPFAPTLDRVNPKRGYVPGNVRVVAAAYNQARGSWGDDVLFLVSAARQKHLKKNAPDALGT